MICPNMNPNLIMLMPEYQIRAIKQILNRWNIIFIIYKMYYANGVLPMDVPLCSWSFSDDCASTFYTDQLKDVRQITSVH